MATLRLDLDSKTITVGRNLVDCLTATAYQASGRLETNKGVCRNWRSTLPISEAEHAIREAARQDGHRIVFFSSQAGHVYSAPVEGERDGKAGA